LAKQSIGVIRNKNPLAPKEPPGEEVELAVKKNRSEREGERRVRTPPTTCHHKNGQNRRPISERRALNYNKSLKN